MTDQATRSKKNRKIDVVLGLVGLVVALAGAAALWHSWPVLAAISVVIVDAYLLAVIFFAAMKADKIHGTYGRGWECQFLFPSRRFGVFLIPVLAATVVIAFAGIYDALPDDAFEELIRGRTDALYFSLITLTTVGFGDITPVTMTAKWTVIAHVASAFLLLFGAFPLLISRIADFSESPDGGTPAPCQGVTEERLREVVKEEVGALADQWRSRAENPGAAAPNGDGNGGS